MTVPNQPNIIRIKMMAPRIMISLPRLPPLRWLAKPPTRQVSPMEPMIGQRVPCGM